MLLGITGKAGSGKDTVADILVEDYGFTKISFASPLKTMLDAIGWAEPKSRVEKEVNIPGFDFSWRKAAQTLGTEWGRNHLDQGLWLKLTMMQITNAPAVNWVISDCRFPNEARAIREYGTLIHVLGRETTAIGEAAAHASEVPVEQCLEDYQITNNDSLAKLRYKIETLMENHLADHKIETLMENHLADHN